MENSYREKSFSTWDILYFTIFYFLFSMKRNSHIYKNQ